MATAFFVFLYTPNAAVVITQFNTLTIKKNNKPGALFSKRHIKVWRVTLGVLLLLLLAVVVMVVLFKGYHRTGHYRHHLNTFVDSTTFLTGDLLFRRGSSLESLLVMAADRGSQYSHVGLVVVEDGTPYVVHTEPGRNQSPDAVVRKETLASYLAPEKATQYALYRMTNRNQTDTLAMQRYAISVYQKKVPFDYEFNHDDTSRLYCSELIRNAFVHGGIDLLLEKKDTVVLFGLKISVILPSTLISQQPFRFVAGYPAGG